MMEHKGAGEELQKYEVFFRDPTNDHRYSFYFMADDFRHAEEQAHDYVEGGQIIKIELYDWEV